LKYENKQHAEPFNSTALPQCVHEVLNVPQSKKEKKEGLKKHKQQQREKKKKTKMRNNVSLPAGYSKKKK